jgi:4-carboxymuconolactone decarboxylase
MTIRMAQTACAAVAMVTVLGQAVGAQDRMPRISPEQMTDEQRQAVAEYFRIRSASALPTSFATLLRSPEVMVRSSALGEYFRRSTLPANLYEWVVLVTARQLDQEYVWAAHYQSALDAGISKELLGELAKETPPTTMSDDQRLLWDLLGQLRRTNRVDDATYQRAVQRFGEQGIVDTVATSGYYTLLGMVMNTAQTPPANGVPRLQISRR